MQKKRYHVIRINLRDDLYLFPPFIDAAAHCWYKRLPVTIRVHTRHYYAKSHHREISSKFIPLEKKIFF